MVKSNAERQAEFRARKRADALHRIAKYEALRKAALDVVEKIDAGWRFECAVGADPMRDCTVERRQEKLDDADRYLELIELWRKDAGLSDNEPRPAPSRNRG